MKELEQAIYMLEILSDSVSMQSDDLVEINPKLVLKQLEKIREKVRIANLKIEKVDKIENLRRLRKKED